MVNGPLSGAIIQPIIGYISDKWVNSGKTRIPFLFAGGILSAIALFALPNADLFITLISPLLFGGIFILLSDIAFNISMHPLRASITDYLPPSQQSKGYSIQTFLISLGAIIGSGLPFFLHSYFDFESTTVSHEIANNVKWSFYIGGILLLLCMLLNIQGIKKSKVINESKPLKNVKTKRVRLSIKDVPNKMWKIGIIQFFSWSAFFLIWVYMTPALAQHYYNEYNYQPTSKIYAEVANYTGFLFAIYHIAAGISSLILPLLFRKLNIIYSHCLALLLGALGLLWIFFSKDLNNLYIAMILIGIAWASILAIPYILLSRFTPKTKIGLYFGLFNLFITIPQIANGLWSGLIVDVGFESKAIFAIVLAGLSLFIASLLSYYYRKDFSD